MGEQSPDVVYFGGDEDTMDDEDEGDSTIEDIVKCMKLEVEENIAAYMEKRELSRKIKVVSCSSDLLEKVTLNYIIAKQILGNLSWQDKMVCKNVCSTWESAILSLSKEQISPEDFVVNVSSATGRDETTFVQSGTFYTEPMVVMAFINTSGFNISYKCETMSPCPCKEPCDKEHSLIDFVNLQAGAPLNLMLTVKANYVSYMPLPQSITSEHTVNHIRNKPFVGGLCIPNIPGVEYHTINIKTNSQSIKEDFFDVVGKLAEKRIFKGVLVYITDKYLLHSVEDIVFLNYFKDVQPGIPYAFGGCIIEDTMTEQSDIENVVDGINNETNDFVSENLLTIGAFTLPKRARNEYNFDMYSLIIDSSDWAKPKIQHSINEFSKQVPRFEHSCAIKLSCVGRDQKHKMEQDCFRAAFPNTRLVGCYGNGELGLNHPAKPETEPMPNTVKRHRRDPGPQFGIMYSYSTVFVYMGWGKILSPKGPG